MSTQPSARFRATVHFDGSGFHGWQLQPRERTVQGELEGCLARLLAEPARIDAAGRTDAGVHAVAQEIAFNAATRWTAADLHRALNALLPGDVWIETVREAEADFHPRFQASGRRYEYFVGVRPDSVSPLWARRLWAVCRPLDVAALSAATDLLRGRRDFSSLSKSGQPVRGTECRVERAEWRISPWKQLHFTIVADRFLHRMVRYIVGTAVEIALGRRAQEDMEDLLRGGSDVRPPIPAPPYGLYLTGVRYGSEWNRAELFAVAPSDPAVRIPTYENQPESPIYEI